MVKFSLKQNFFRFSIKHNVVWVQYTTTSLEIYKIPPVMTNSHVLIFTISESVDSISRDGPDMPYM